MFVSKRGMTFVHVFIVGIAAMAGACEHHFDIATQLGKAWLPELVRNFEWGIWSFSNSLPWSKLDHTQMFKSIRSLSSKIEQDLDIAFYCICWAFESVWDEWYPTI